MTPAPIQNVHHYDYSDVIDEVLLGAKTATKFIDERTTVKATYFGKRDARDRRHMIMVSVGRPNYAERKVIKRYKRAGVPLPPMKLKASAKKR